VAKRQEEYPFVAAAMSNENEMNRSLFAHFRWMAVEAGGRKKVKSKRLLAVYLGRAGVD
jgi:hypothetical protein